MLFAGFLPLLSLLLHYLSVIEAAEVPHNVRPLTQPSIEQQPLHSVNSRTPKRVAIIGAGSAGASSAYYLRRYANNGSIPVNITIYERASYIGGRSTTINVRNDPTLPVELGASIFVAVNQNLVSAAKEFNLSVSAAAATRRKTSTTREAPETLGVWNGEEFVYTQTLGGGRWQSWWSNAKLLYRYGFAPLRTVNLMKTVTGRFFQLYDAPNFPFSDLSQVAYDVGLTAVTSATGEQYLAENTISDLFAKEIVQASTRVNYAQNLAQIHGLETMVCMATDGAMSVEGGNWQIFESMVSASGASIVLNTSVTEVQRQDNGQYLIKTSTSKATPASKDEEPNPSVSSTHPADETFDEIILAAPYHQSSISFTPSLDHTPDNIPYVHLHVTLFSTRHALSPSFFNLASTFHVPTVILTTLHPNDSPYPHHNQRAPAAGLAGFFSISLLRSVPGPTPSSPAENVYKIFSPHAVDAAFLRALLGLPPPDLKDPEGEEPGEIGKEDVSWLYRKVWLSYPYLPPRVTFERIGLAQGVWYTAGIEGFISTMETSSLMGMDVAALIVKGWVGEEAGDEGEGKGDGEGERPGEGEGQRGVGNDDL